MIDGSEKCNRQLGFEFRICMFVKSAVILLLKRLKECINNTLTQKEAQIDKLEKE